MTIRLTNLVLLLAATLNVAAQATDKTFIKSFNLDGKNHVRLDLPGTIDVKMWDNPVMRFQINVNFPSGNSAMLNELANVGRYNLMARMVDDVLVIEAPNLQKQVKVKGQEIREILSFVVYVPRTTDLELPGATAMALPEKK